MKNIRRKYNQMVDLSKFISKKKILSGVVAIYYNQVYNQTLPRRKLGVTHDGKY